MDEQRIQNVAYQYLCRLEEAKRQDPAVLLGSYCIHMNENSTQEHMKYV